MDKKINQLIEIAEFAMEANDYAHAEKKYINALYLMDNPKSEEYQKVVNKLAKCYAAQKILLEPKSVLKSYCFTLKKIKI